MGVARFGALCQVSDLIYRKINTFDSSSVSMHGIITRKIRLAMPHTIHRIFSDGISLNSHCIFLFDGSSISFYMLKKSWFLIRLYLFIRVIV